MDPKFFSQDKVKPINKIFNVDDFVSKQLFGKDDQWLSQFINGLLNDDNFDFFKACLDAGHDKPAEVTSFAESMINDVFL